MMKYNHYCDYTWCGIIAMMIVKKSLHKPAAKLVAVK